MSLILDASRDLSLSFSVADNEVAEWFVIRIGDQPHGTRASLLSFAFSGFDTAVRSGFAGSVGMCGAMSMPRSACLPTSGADDARAAITS